MYRSGGGGRSGGVTAMAPKRNTGQRRRRLALKKQISISESFAKWHSRAVTEEMQGALENLKAIQSALEDYMAAAASSSSSSSAKRGNTNKRKRTAGVPSRKVNAKALQRKKANMVAAVVDEAAVADEASQETLNFGTPPRNPPAIPLAPEV